MQPQDAKSSTNNQPNPIPGCKSLLYWGSFLLGAGLLLFGRDETDYDRAVYALTIAGTTLLTDNTIARYASVVGGAARICSSARIGMLGIFAQTAALGYAAKESIEAGIALRRSPAASSS